MKKYLLLNSPIFWDATKEKEQYLSPLGLGYIATYLEKEGIQVTLVDCVKEEKSVKEILELIDFEKPDFVGMNIFTQNYDIVKYIMEHISVDTECFIGGQVVKSIYKDILEWKVNNRFHIVIGEGEWIIPQIAMGKCVESPLEVNGSKYVYRVDKDSVYFPKDISGIRLDRKYFGNEIITNHYGENEAAIITSRGCMYDCAFCGGARSLNRDSTIRIRNRESVVREIKDIQAMYPDVRSIRILDDLFLRNAKSIDMANDIFSEFSQLSWRGMAHIASLAGCVEKVKELKRGHCRELFIGIESGSDAVRRKINKKGSLDDILKVSKEILQSGIDLKGYFIYGFPGETKHDFQKTFELACELKKISVSTPGQFRTSVFQFRPYHGTQLYREIIQDSGILHSCKFNESISQFEGRSQFNFDFGNYSLEADDLLNEYIIKTQAI